MLFRILCVCAALFIAAAAASEAQLLRADYQSTVDGSKRQYFVYLPQGYEQKAAKNGQFCCFCMAMASAAMASTSWITL